MATSLADVPSDELVPTLALPGSRTKHQTSQQPSLTIAHSILKVLSHRPAKTKIMKLAKSGGHELPLGLITADLPDLEPAQFSTG